jgi:uncharacterized membrane protein
MTDGTPATLEDLLRKRARELGSEWEALKTVYREWVENKLVLVDPKPPAHFIEYLERIEYSLWLWTSLLIIILTAVSIPLSSVSRVFLYLRYVLGTIFVLYIPGMSLIEALYPDEKSLSPLEKLALSIGLSLALVPLVGLVLNYTPWGIRLDPILASLTSLSLALLFTAAYRKFIIALKM